MHVLLATPGHPAHDERFRRAIDAAGHRVTTLVVDPGQPVEAGAAVIRAAIERDPPDVVQAGPLDTVAVRAVAAGARPLVAMSWAFDLLGPGSPPAEAAGLAESRETLAAADALVVDCLATGSIARDLGFPADRTVLLPWGVDLDAFRPGRPAEATELRAALGWQEATVVVTARAHEPVYGVDVAVDAFLRSAADRPELRLLVLSSGSLTAGLEARVAAAVAQSRVQFTGRIPNDDLPRHLSAADIYLSASHLDGSSVTLLEAMASGLPGVVSDIPGNREWITDGVSGALFADGDATTGALALSAIATLPATERRAIGAAARQVAVKRADWSRNVPRLFAAYRIARERTTQAS
jgi:glycosyltransferase involved in cell wall biosynthesis